MPTKILFVRFFPIAGHLFCSETSVVTKAIAHQWVCRNEQHNNALRVQSMPSMQEAAQLSSSDPDADYKVEDFLCASSASLGEKEVSIPALLAVICHKAPKARGGSALPPGGLSPEEHTEVKPSECSKFEAILCCQNH